MPAPSGIRETDMHSRPSRLLLGELDVYCDGTDDRNYCLRLKLLYCIGESDLAFRADSLALLLI